MILNPISRFQKRIVTPRSLYNIVDVGEDEVNPEWLGITEDDKAAVWRAVKNLYRTGLHPMINICIRRHGEVVLHRTIGHREGNGFDEQDLDPVLATVDTPQIIFSCSKAFTAMVIHHMHEHELIDIDHPVAEYVPDFAAHGKDRITIHQILSHQAGVYALPSLPIESLFEPEKIRELMMEARPETKAGEQVAYHAVSGGFVLAELVKSVTGDTIKAYWQKHVKDVLGFRFFDYGAAPDDLPLLARNYKTGLPVLYPWTKRFKVSLGASLDEVVDVSNDPRMYDQIVPAGNMVATANELSQMMQCLLNGGELDGKRIFRPETVERATREVSPTWPEAALLIPLRFSEGFMLGDRPASIFGPDNRQAFGHLGFTNKFCWADPERKISVGILTSGNPTLGTHVPQLLLLLNAIARRFSKV